MEAVLYTVMKKFTDKATLPWAPPMTIIVSFGAGLVIANILPGIF